MKKLFFNFLKNLFFIIAIACILITINYSNLNILFLAISAISVVVCIILVSIFDSLLNNNFIFSKVSSDEYNQNFDNSFRHLSEGQQKAMDEIVEYVQSHGGGQTFLEMDDDSRIRLKTVVKEYNNDVAIDLGDIVFPNEKYKVDSPDWKLEMNKILDDLSIKVKELLGNIPKDENVDKENNNNLNKENNNNNKENNNGENK